MAFSLSVSRSPLFYGCALVLVCALLLGGGTHSGFLSDMLLQAAALPLLAAALWHILQHPLEAPPKRALFFCAAFVAVVLVQLVPLPPGIWTALPYRHELLATYQLLGTPPPWRPLSVDPAATWASLLSLIVPLAIFLSAVQLGSADRRILTIVVLCFAVVEIFLGLSQVALGGGAVRFYEFSNQTEATGFFANRNHFAAFLYCALVFATVWAIEASLSSSRASGSRDRLNQQTRYAIGIAAIFTLMIALIAAQAMARSRAGLALTIAAMLGGLALAVRDRRQIEGISSTKLLGAAIAVAVMLAGQFALFRIMQRFGTDPLQNARVAFGGTTLEAATGLMPAGAGMGTFVPMFGLFEKPATLLPNMFANRAHNDALEFWLEAGVAALVLGAVFMSWFVLRAVAAWRAAGDDSNHLDVALTRAATLVVGLLLAHSLVDYPLRTGAMAAVFALACALLIAPARQIEAPKAARKHAASREVASPAMQQRPVETPATPSPIEWTPNVDWPDEWQRRS